MDKKLIKREITSAKWSNHRLLLGNGEEVKTLNDLSTQMKGTQIAVVETYNIGKKVVKITTGLFHLHTCFSLLDGQILVPKLAKKLLGENNTKIEEETHEIVFTEYPQVCAITDHGNMFGSYAFSTTLEEVGLIPIIGCEVYVESISGKKDANHLVLLCKNKKGYNNLCHMISESEENFYNKPHVSWDMLTKYSEGLVCLSACLGGEIPQKILNNDFDGAIEVAENFQEIFGEDFYIEIQSHNIMQEDRVRPYLVRIAKELGIKMVCTSDTHYLHKTSAKAHEVLLAIGTKSTLNNPNRYRFEGERYHVPTNVEMNEWFDFLQESLDTHAEIAMKCEFRFKPLSVEMPNFETGAMTLTDAFRKACWDGFDFRFKDKNIDEKVYRERLQYEIDVIEKMQFEGYFLIVQDAILYAKRNKIGVGPGRGSAVGSLVAFCLQITNLDPIPYDLLFERFLNPERISLPDIDTDYQDTRRDEVIEYVRQKYGDENVSKIITFGTLSAKSVIRDVGRVLDVPRSLVDKVAKSIPNKPKITIDKALEMSTEFAEFYKDEQVATIINIAKELEGITRHKSQHACGVVISKKPVSDYVPEVILEDKQGNPARTAAFDKVEIEYLGLLKMDFLGLRNMTIIQNSLDYIGKKEEEIPLIDPYVYAYLSKGETDGIFQLESPGIRSVVKDMFSDIPLRLYKLEEQYGVKSFEEACNNAEAKKAFEMLGKEGFERLIATISLYRPGPMEYIPQYIEGMKNPKSIKYDTPELKSILKPTYGTIVYQEQVQRIVRELAGYSLGRGDLIRRAMGKFLLPYTVMCIE